MTCYPTLSDMIYGLTGLKTSLPIQTFGFFMALAFAGSAWMLVRELKRKERMGLMPAAREQKLFGEPAKWHELLINGLIGFLFGFKLIPAITNYSEFASDPQSFLVSGQGSWIAGILLAGLMAFLTWREKEKNRINPPELREVIIRPHERINDLLVYGAIFGILGARLMVMIEKPESFREFFENPAQSFFSGLSIYGGLILGGAAILYYAYKKKLSILNLGDAFGPTMMLGYAIGRMGCQFSGDGDWGIVNTAPKPGWLSWAPDWFWAYNYPNNVNQDCNPYQGDEALEHPCNFAETPYLVDPVFPTPVYEIIVALLLMGVLLYLSRRIRIPGMIFSIYLFMNGFERILVEQIRVNTPYEHLLNLTQAEIVAICLMLGGIALGVTVWRNRGKQPPESGHESAPEVT